LISLTCFSCIVVFYIHIHKMLILFVILNCFIVSQNVRRTSFFQRKMENRNTLFTIESAIPSRQKCKTDNIRDWKQIDSIQPNSKGFLQMYSNCFFKNEVDWAKLKLIFEEIVELIKHSLYNSHSYRVYDDGSLL
jgi:hypothetical protein